METVQIIDEDGKFIYSYENIIEYFNVGNDKNGVYPVFIFGAQSTGKSTLMNSLFNTKFEVSSDEDPLSPTTRGLCLGVSYTTDGKVLLIIDVQGSDNSEDSRTFDNKSCLFSIAAGSVLIVNMMEKDLVHIEGGQRRLLETVFGAMLKLTKKSEKVKAKEMKKEKEKEIKRENVEEKGKEKEEEKGKIQKTTLLFALRDFHRAMPDPRRAEYVKKMLNDVWAGIPEAKDTNMYDLFIIQYYGMPNIVECEIGSGYVESLRKRFIDPDDFNFLFKDDVPVRKYKDMHEAVCSFEMLWNDIMLSRELDVESTLDMIARLRRISTVSKVAGFVGVGVLVAGGMACGALLPFTIPALVGGAVALGEVFGFGAAVAVTGACAGVVTVGGVTGIVFGGVHHVATTKPTSSSKGFKKKVKKAGEEEEVKSPGNADEFQEDHK